MRHLHLLCALHQGIADARRHIDVNIMRHTVFQNIVSLTAAHIAKEHRISVPQHRHILQAALRIDHRLHAEALVQTVLLNHTVRVHTRAVNDHGTLGEKRGEIPLSFQSTPNHRAQELHGKRGQYGAQIHERSSQQTRHAVKNDIGKQNRKGLAVYRFADAL